MENLKSNKFIETLCFIFIGVGILLRLIEYSHNNSFWLDETLVSLSVINLSYKELTGPLLYDHHAPIGFLFIQKIISSIFGTTEYILRLYPLCSSIISLFLFYKLSSFFLNKKSRLLSVILFSCCYALIHYGSEAKPYSGDVLLCLILYLTYFNLKDESKNIYFVLFGVLGAISVWCAYSQVFVLASIGISLIIRLTKEKKYKILFKYFISFFMWGLSFIGFYLQALSRAVNEKLVIDVFGQFYVPQPFGLKSLQWICDMFFRFLSFIPQAPEAIFFIVLGWTLMLKKEPLKFLLLFLPLPLCLFASYLHQYPFWQRAILYLIPSIIIFISYSVEGILKLFNLKYKNLEVIIGIFISFLLIFTPIISSISNISSSTSRQEVRSAFSFLSKNLQPQDTIYFHKHLMYALKYYGKRYGFIEPKDLEPSLRTFNIKRIFTEPGYTLILGNSSGADTDKEFYFNQLKEDFQLLKGKKRVWIFLTNLKWRAYYETEFIKNNLLQGYKPLKEFKAEGIELYLYDLSN